MEQIIFALRIVIISNFLIVMLGYYFNSNDKRLSRWFTLLLSGVICAVILNTYSEHASSNFYIRLSMYPVMALAALTPGFFMIYHWVLTRDDTPFPKILIFAIIVQIILEIVNMPCYLDDVCVPVLATDFAPYGQLGFLLTSALRFLFILLGMIWIIRGLNADLVDARRKLRIQILFPIYSVLIIVEYPIEILITNSSNSGEFYILNTLLYLILVSVSLVIGLRSGFQELNRVAPESEKTRSSTEAIESYPALTSDKARFNEVFITNKIYRDQDLTVKKLAKEMDVPQYRLRRLINSTMGYRNFNELLNSYRVDDFCEQVKAEKSCDSGITELAFSVGFNSLSTFNQVFRHIKKITPTEFRQLHFENSNSI